MVAKRLRKKRGQTPLPERPGGCFAQRGLTPFFPEPQKRSVRGLFGEAGTIIRIKCPKCSIVLNLDDDEAGQVGKCDDCGAKFRVPAKKAAAASKPSARAEEEEEEEKDEDEDEEDEGDERDEVSSKAAALAAKQAKMKIVTSIASGVGLLLLALGGVFINMVALLSAIISILLIVICVLLAMREAYRTPRADDGRSGVCGFGRD